MNSAEILIYRALWWMLFYSTWLEFQAETLASDHLRDLQAIGKGHVTP